ncbi:glycosyltransferase [Kordiimonas sp. SCSIO 12610]|uniref:glycosyltransferase n=1 Tax=Kordiimonas sp. SCSIO 12610 TaxID=2829597 RepID=UPI00210DF60E|nr:glycosyltransferase [Kordiimonas sp. SCSIO 12610]UTW55872.1 hypothetical protein KFF44_02980 [Kordiimonas sp. SCSIO 12610]
MIFLSVGSELPFSRMVKAADLWHQANSEYQLIAQIGNLESSDYQPVSCEAQSLVDPDEYQRLSNEATILIAHAGMGSIINALTLGKPIVIMPRRGHLKETRNDHQYATAKKFADKKGVFVAWDETEFAGVMSEALAFSRMPDLNSGSRFAQKELLDNIRNFIDY